LAFEAARSYLAIRVKSLRLYVLTLVALGGVWELACRHWQPLFRAASHRSLFKVALLERRLPRDVVFFGTSRTGEALRPGPFVAELADSGSAQLTAFNVSTPYTSLEILGDVTRRFMAAPGLKLAIVEVSRHQMYRAPVPWAVDDVGPDADLDARAFSWFAHHSALFAERKVFVLNSLARLGGISLFGSRFDGTEEFGTDFVASVLGRSHDVAPEKFHAEPCVPDLAPASDRLLATDPASKPFPRYAEETRLYEDIARGFAEHGVKVLFYVPPTIEVGRPENDPEHRLMRANLRALTGRPVWSYAECRLPADYFRDGVHLSHLGGSHFSRMLARAVAADPELAEALGHALP
jgi:hypothetical protein